MRTVPLLRPSLFLLYTLCQNLGVLFECNLGFENKLVQWSNEISDTYGIYQKSNLYFLENGLNRLLTCLFYRI